MKKRTKEILSLSFLMMAINACIVLILYILGWGDMLILGDSWVFAVLSLIIPIFAFKLVALTSIIATFIAAIFNSSVTLHNSTDFFFVLIGLIVSIIVYTGLATLFVALFRRKKTD